MRTLIAVAISIVALASTPAHSADVAAQIEALRWMTEQYPPYNYVDEGDGQLKGIAVDVLMGIFERCGARLTRADLKVVPWSRGYRAVLKTPGSALFSTTYTEERLQRLRFVGPIFPTRVSIIAKKGRGLRIDSVADMGELTIGTIRDDIGDQLLRELGVAESALERKNSAIQILQMLDRGRLDAIAYAEDIARHQFARAGIDPVEYESVYVLHEGHMGYSFHRDTDAVILQTLQTALDELRAEGMVDSIYAAYLGTAGAERCVSQSRR